MESVNDSVEAPENTNTNALNPTRDERAMSVQEDTKMGLLDDWAKNAYEQ